MTKNEFMTQLINELHRRKVSDAEDVAEEYEQHFAFKLADGYTEEEIASRLGDPAALAAQFEPSVQTGAKRPAVLTWLWLIWCDLFFGIFAVLLLSFGVVLAAAALSFGLTGVCLVFDLGRLPWVSLPAMPYWCGAVLGISLLALCVLTVVGCVWFFACIRQLFHAYGRFHKNTLAPCRGCAQLPALPAAPQFSPRAKRRLRRMAIGALILFAVSFVLSYIICSLSAGSLEFWHVWGWFGYNA